MSASQIPNDPHAIGLDRNEVRTLLVAAGLGSAIEHALISLLALNGLRVSEATRAKIEALGLERGHRTRESERMFGDTRDTREVPIWRNRATAVAVISGARPGAMRASAWLSSP
jgi:integrase